MLAKIHCLNLYVKRNIFSQMAGNNCNKLPAYLVDAKAVNLFTA